MFEQGLANLSWNTSALGRATNMLLEHLIHTLPIRESQLKAIIEASIEMDLGELERIVKECLHT